MICPFCFVNLLRWQSYLTDFLVGDPGGDVPSGCSC